VANGDVRQLQRGTRGPLVVHVFIQQNVERQHAATTCHGYREIYQKTKTRCRPILSLKYERFTGSNIELHLSQLTQCTRRQSRHVITHLLTSLVTQPVLCAPHCTCRHSALAEQMDEG